jgi:hydroxymethylpyrimidine pyrophosphatase-like HAD family hydrolase
MPAVRDEAETMLEGDCAITTAVPGMLEFLPLGASKGAAVERLLRRLGRVGTFHHVIFACSQNTNGRHPVCSV